MCARQALCQTKSNPKIPDLANLRISWLPDERQMLIFQSFGCILFYFLPGLMVFTFLLFIILSMKIQVLCYTQGYQAELN